MTSNFTKEQLQQMNIPTTNQFSDMLGFATSFGVGGL